jgi:hypothetical protein
MVRGRNTVQLTYTLLGGDKPIDLELRPLLALRRHPRADLPVAGAR